MTVNELVDKVKEQVMAGIAAHDIAKQMGISNLDMESDVIAKQILSHPDLALIDRSDITSSACVDVNYNAIPMQYQ